MSSSLFFSSSAALLLPPPPPSSSRQSPPPPPHRLQFKPHHHHHHLLRHLSSQFPPPSLRSIKSYSSSVSNEGKIPVIDFEEFIEKDWSFLDNPNSIEEKQNHKYNRIISAGDINENSRVLVSISSENFIDRLIEYSPLKLLLIVHDSLFVLAGIKEKYDDKVKCWQGEIIYVPEKWVPFDVVYLYYLSGLPFQLHQIFGALAERCSPGARVIISHPQGKVGLEQQRKEYPDVVISDLPDKTTLEKVAADHSFDITEYVDEPDIYLAVLKFGGEAN